jgi:hypothetical protein
MLSGGEVLICEICACVVYCKQNKCYHDVVRGNFGSSHWLASIFGSCNIHKFIASPENPGRSLIGALHRLAFFKRSQARFCGVL